MSDEVTTILADAQPAPQTVLIPAGEGPVLNAFGDTIQVKLGAEHTGGSLSVVLDTTPPGGGPPPHIHRNEDELFLILEGQYRFLANGQWVEAGPGAVAYVPRGTVHTFQNIGDTPCRHWVITTPSGFETFFRRCSDVFALAGPPDMARILSISAEHGIEFIMPEPDAAPAA